MKAKVFNVSKEEYTEKFKGRTVTIPAGEFIVMEAYEAAQFKGNYPGKGVIKMIKIEPIPENDNKDEKFVCNFCGFSFLTVAALNEHIKMHKPKEEPAKKGTIDDTREYLVNRKGADK
jgi:hypothetical protein